MLISEFERDFGDSPDSEDAVRVLGKSHIQEGAATIDDIRRVCYGKAKNASILPQSDGWGFYVSEFKGKL